MMIRTWSTSSNWVKTLFSPRENTVNQILLLNSSLTQYHLAELFSTHGIRKPFFHKKYGAIVLLMKATSLYDFCAFCTLLVQMFNL